MTQLQTVSQAGTVFNDILSPYAFLAPEALRPMATWQEHIPFAFWLIERAAPRVVVELGTLTGSSFLAFCQAVQGLGLSTRCFGVDRWKYISPEYGDNIYSTLADYTASRYGAFAQLIRNTFDEALPRFEDGAIDLLHIDGDHSYESVRHDFETWRPKLSTRAVVLFHDSNVRGYLPEMGQTYGVYKLWSELIEAYPDHFQFFHCDGLAVLGYGTELPEPVRRFFEVARNPDVARLIQNIYGRLGSHCSATLMQQFTRDLMQDGLAAQAVPGAFAEGCGTKTSAYIHSVRRPR